MTIHLKRRLWYWRFVHYWSIIRLRRRVVFGLAVLGVFVALIITANTTTVFSSRATIRDDAIGDDVVDAQGVITNYPPTPQTPDGSGHYIY